MEFSNTKVLWITVDLEALTISDLTEEEKNEIRKEIKDIKGRNPDVDKIFIVLKSEYDDDVICDENFEEIE